MQNFILGISITLNVVLIVAIIIYFRIKALGFKKVEQEFAKNFYLSDDEINEKLKEW